jgi:AcrR family transcriptional regulator
VPIGDLRASRTGALRGPAKHSIRDEIISTAEEYFGHFGYEKTRVAALANAIGFSKAYIYKFFDSKEAIGEEICSRCLSSLVDSVEERVAEGASSAAKIALIFEAFAVLSADLFLRNRKIYDLATYSYIENWPSADAYTEKVGTILTRIIQDGRASGDFERKTPIDETVRAIIHALKPFMHPLMFRYNLDALPKGAGESARLVLRSLTP